MPFLPHSPSKVQDKAATKNERTRSGAINHRWRTRNCNNRNYAPIGDDEIYESAEAKAEVETAKRRSRFQFSMIGLKPGTELQLFKDPTIICKTVDEQNKVDFKGDVTTLSDAAMQALHSIGIEWPTVSGPWEWAYQGRRLDEIRREIEEKSD